MRKKLQPSLLCGVFGICSVKSVLSVVHFQHDFDNAAPRLVQDVAHLGVPAEGSFSFSRFGNTQPETPVGNISSVGRTYLFAHRGTGVASTNGHENPTTLPSQINGGSVANPTYFYSASAGYGSTSNGTSLRADFNSPAHLTPGQTVNVGFDIGSFGTNNPASYKLMLITGLNANGDALFNLAYQAGSVAATRELYVSDGSGGGQGAFISVTPTSNNTSTIGGATRVLDSSSSTFNSTAPANPPSTMLTINLELSHSEDQMLDLLTVSLGGNGSNLGLTPEANDEFSLDYYPSNFGFGEYNELVALDFTAVWDSRVNNENKGFWLDNISVTSIPEPSSVILLASSILIVLGVRNRRQN